MAGIYGITHIIEDSMTRSAGQEVLGKIAPHRAGQTVVQVLTNEFLELSTVHLFAPCQLSKHSLISYLPDFKRNPRLRNWLVAGLPRWRFDTAPQALYHPLLLILYE